LGAEDRARLNQQVTGQYITGQYITGVRELEWRLRLAQAWERRPKPIPPETELVDPDSNRGGSSEAPHPGDRGQKWRNLSRACDAVRS
jgi:hypothetical protein